jgi:hypothetical protein
MPLLNRMKRTATNNGHTTMDAWMKNAIGNAMVRVCENNGRTRTGISTRNATGIGTARVCGNRQFADKVDLVITHAAGTA